MNAREIVNSIVETGDAEYSQAFKLLGFTVFLAEEGPDAFLAGNLLSPRTYFRWIEILRAAGLEGLALDARLRQLLAECLRSRFGGLPIDRAREGLLDAVGSMLTYSEVRSLQAMSRQASAGVKGERSEVTDREAKPSALDAGADGGSLRQATAPEGW